MTSRGDRGRWQHVLKARQQAREALGKDPGQGDLFEGSPRKKSATYVPLQPPQVAPRRDESVGVLTLGEAAVRLGLSRGELERMIAAGTIETLPGQFTRFVPTSEVERLEARRGAGS